MTQCIICSQPMQYRHLEYRCVRCGFQYACENGDPLPGSDLEREVEELLAPGQGVTRSRTRDGRFVPAVQ